MKQLFKFAIVGATGFFVNTAILYFLTEKLSIFYMISAIIALQCSIPTQYLLNNIWTFKDSFSFKKFIKYEYVCLTGMLLFYTIMIVSTEIFGIYYLLSNFIATISVFLLNYYNSKKYVWIK